MRLHLYILDITDEIISASKICLKKVVEGIEVDADFTSNDVALKFTSIIMERETKVSSKHY